jgi:DNA-binding NarL/FixJ family response regulator
MGIRILIADDHAVVRDGLSELLRVEREMEVVAVARDGREAVRRAVELRPNVVVMAIAMPELNGIEATREIRAACDATRVVILSMYATSQHVHCAARAGADGYVVKRGETVEIIEAIRAVHNGKRYICRMISGAVARDFLNGGGRESPLERLSSRERQMLQIILEGKTSVEIASTFSLSVKTIETYRSRMMRKLGIRNLPSLVKFAIQHGITSLD